MTDLAEHLSDFYSACETCGRSGHDRVFVEYPGDTQCAVCLETRLRVAERESACILDRWKSGERAPRP